MYHTLLDNNLTLINGCFVGKGEKNKKKSKCYTIAYHSSSCVVSLVFMCRCTVAA